MDFEPVQGIERLLLNVSTPPHSLIGRFCVGSYGDFPVFDSVICESFPTVLSMFQSHIFRLLYRGSRDGFRGLDFHKACDNHSRTIVLIRSENGFIFWGYSPQAWHSGSTWSPDSTLTCFLFTIQNPHGTKPMIFPIKEDQQQYSIYGNADRGPHFGGIYVCRECNVY
jgi:hypothetical protein